MGKFNRIVISSLVLSVSNAFADVERVSVSSNGEQAARQMSASSPYIGSASGKCTLSDNGQFVVFSSPSSNLVDNDTNEEVDIFVHDRAAASTTRVNVASDGSQASGGLKTASYINQGKEAQRACISGDGRYISFESRATNLRSVFSSAYNRLYLHDRLNGTTTLIAALGGGEILDMSADGRFIAYSTFDNNNGGDNLYVYDQELGNFDQIPVPAKLLNLDGDRDVYSVSLSDDGQSIAYCYTVYNRFLDFNVATACFLYDRVSETHTEYSTPVISGNGRFVVSQRGSDGFVHDRDSGTTRKIVGMNGASSISSDGRFVVSRSSGNLIVLDLNTGKRAWVTETESADLRKTDGASGIRFRSTRPSISSDGNYIAFTSSRDDLIDADSNQTDDVFVAQNPLIELQNQSLSVAKLVNYQERVSPRTPWGRLLQGTLFHSAYEATNNSSERLYDVKIYDDGEPVCDLYVLEPGQTKRRCSTFKYIENWGESVNEVQVRAKVSQTGELRVADSRSYFSAFSSIQSYNYRLNILYQVKDKNGKWVSTDNFSGAAELAGEEAEILIRIENDSPIALYRVKVYHDTVSPVNGGWVEQCNFGTVYEGQTKYCKRTVNFASPGLNTANVWVRADNALSGSTYVVKNSDQIHVNVP